MTCCINWNRSSKEREAVLLFFFCLEFTEMFNNPFFSAYARSGEKRQGKEEIKENLKMRLFGFEGLVAFTHFSWKNKNMKRIEKAHMQSAGYSHPAVESTYQSISGPIKKDEHLTADSTWVSSPRKLQQC